MWVKAAVMTIVLQGAFVVAGLLMLVAIVISARALIGAGSDGSEREIRTSVVVKGALLFCGSMYTMATVLGRLGDRIGDDGTVLYAAVFGFATGALTYMGQGPEGQTPEGQRRRPLSRAIRFLAFALPIGSGLIAGVVGTV